jgi:hypothetical protein
MKRSLFIAVAPASLFVLVSCSGGSSEPSAVTISAAPATENTEAVIGP